MADLQCCKDENLDKKTVLADIKRAPHEVFANDIFFFLCQELNVEWIPPCYEEYKIEETSPLTKDIRTFLRNSCGDFYARFEFVYHATYSDDWEKFQEYNRNMCAKLAMLFLDTNEKDAFYNILDVAVSCVVLHRFGMKDSITFGVSIMTHALDMLNHHNEGKAFSGLSSYANLMNLCEIQKTAEIINEPHKVFANDFIFFLCRESNIEWLPENCESYEIHRASPFTKEIRELIKTLKNYTTDSDYTFNMFRAGCGKQSGVIYEFKNRVESELHSLRSVRIPFTSSVSDLLEKLLDMAQLSIAFDQRSNFDILRSIVPKFFETLEAINQVNNGRIFDLLAFGATQPH